MYRKVMSGEYVQYVLYIHIAWKRIWCGDKQEYDRKKKRHTHNGEKEAALLEEKRDFLPDCDNKVMY
jgi:hypothetical protein